MKRFRFLLLALVTIISVCTSCGGRDGQSPDTYRTAAQKFIDAGNYDSAIQALEEGIEATGDESLKALLEDVKAMQAELDAPEKDYSEFAGLWAEEDLSWSSGGAVLEISVRNKIMTIHFSIAQPESQDQTFTIEYPIHISDIADDAIMAPLSDSGQGTLTVKLVDTETVLCRVKDSSSVEELSGWEDCDGTYTLIPSPDAYDLLKPVENSQPPSPEPTLEPAPEAAPEVPAAVSGQFDNFVGTWQDENGTGLFLCIGYSDATKQRAFVHAYLVQDFEAELSTEDGTSASGVVILGSDPTYAISMVRYKYWLETYIYIGEIDREEYIKFVPADPDSWAPSNPYYTG